MPEIIEIKFTGSFQGGDNVTQAVKDTAEKAVKIIDQVFSKVESSDLFKSIISGLESLKTASQGVAKETQKSSETLQKEFTKAQKEAETLSKVVKGMGADYARMFTDTNKFISGLRVGDIVDLMESLKRQFAFIEKNPMFKNQINETMTMTQMVEKLYEMVAKYNSRAKTKIELPELEMKILEAIKESAVYQDKILHTEQVREAILMKNVALEAEQAAMMSQQTAELSKIETIEKERESLLQKTLSVYEQMERLSGSLKFLGDQAGFRMITEGLERLRVVYEQIKKSSINELASQEEIARINSELIGYKNQVLSVANAIGISYEREIKSEVEIIRLYQMRQQMIQASITPMQMFLQIVERLGLAMQAITWSGQTTLFDRMLPTMKEAEATLLLIRNTWDSIKSKLAQDVPLPLATRFDAMALKLDYIQMKLKQIMYDASGGRAAIEQPAGTFTMQEGGGGYGGTILPPAVISGMSATPNPEAWNIFEASLRKLLLASQELYQQLQQIAMMKGVKGDFFNDATASAKALEAEIDRAIQSLSTLGMAQIGQLPKEIMSLRMQAQDLEGSFGILTEREIKLNKELATGKITAEAYAQGMAEIVAQQDRLKASALDLQGKLANAFTNLKSQGIQQEYSQLEARLKRLGSTAIEASEKVNILKQMMELTKQQIILNGDHTGKLNEQYKMLATRHKEASKEVYAAEGILRKYGMQMQQLIKWQFQWYAGAGLIWGAFFKIKDAVSEFLSYSQGLTDVGAITGATAEELKKMDIVARQVATSSTMGFRAGADALKIMGQAGMSAADSMEALNTVAMLTTATGASTVDVVKLLTTSMNVWNIAATDSTRIGNALAAALNYSKLEIGDLAVAFNYVAPQARLMGESLESTLGMVATLSQMGIRASTIGTGLSQFMGSLLAPTKRFNEALAKVNLSVKDLTDSQGRLLPFIGIIQKLEKAGMDVATVFEGLEKREARNLATSLVAGSYAFEQMEKAIGGTSAMTVMFNKSIEGTQNQLKVLGNQILDVIFSILKEFEPAVVFLAKAFKELLITIKEIGPYLLALGGIAALPKLFTLVTAGVTALVAALKGLTVAGVATPWGLIAVGIASLIGAVTLLRTHFDDAKNAKEQWDRSLESSAGLTKEAAEVHQLIGVMKSHNTSLEQKEVAYNKLKSIVPGLSGLYKNNEEAIKDLSGETSRATEILTKYTDEMIRNAIIAQLQGSKGIVAQFEAMKKQAEGIQNSFEGLSGKPFSKAWEYVDNVLIGNRATKLLALQTQINKMTTSGEIKQLIDNMTALGEKEWQFAKSTGLVNDELTREIELKRAKKSAEERPTPGGKSDDKKKTRDYYRSLVSDELAVNKDLLTIQKEHERTILADLEEFHRLGLIDDKKYYESKQAISEYYTNENIKFIDQAEQKLRDMVFEKIKDPKITSDPEQFKKLWSDYSKNLTELEKQRTKEIEDNARKRGKTETDGVLNTEKKISEIRQFNYKLDEERRNQALDELLDSLKKEESANEYLYAQKEITSTVYFNKQFELIEQEKKAKIAALEAEMIAFITTQYAEIEALRSRNVINEEAYRKYYENITQYYQGYLGNIKKVEQASADRTIDIQHKTADSIQYIWETQGVGGVINVEVQRNSPLRVKRIPHLGPN